MKNRLLQYLQPEQGEKRDVVEKVPQPARETKPRKATKGKRICVCRFQSYFDTPEKNGTLRPNGGPSSITVGADGDYRMFGRSCTPREAFRVFCVWKFGFSPQKNEQLYVDRFEVERLFNLAVPREEEAPEPTKDDNEGEDWKAE